MYDILEVLKWPFSVFWRSIGPLVAFADAVSCISHISRMHGGPRSRIVNICLGVISNNQNDNTSIQIHWCLQPYLIRQLGKSISIICLVVFVAFYRGPDLNLMCHFDISMVFYRLPG